MKKVLTVGAIALLGFTVSAQQMNGHFKIGPNVGIPVGDVSDYSSFTAGIDAAYQFELAEDFYLGVASGYQHYFAKEYEVLGVTYKPEDFGYIPLAATGQYSITPNFFIGGDIGYAFYTNNSSSNDGGLYYQPKLGYQTDKMEVYVGYKGISEDETNIGSVNLGVNFKL